MEEFMPENNSQEARKAPQPKTEPKAMKPRLMPMPKLVSIEENLKALGTKKLKYTAAHK